MLEDHKKSKIYTTQIPKRFNKYSVLQIEIFDEVNGSSAVSFLADETADISRKEQLSVGVRFADEKELYSKRRIFRIYA